VGTYPFTGNAFQNVIAGSAQYLQYFVKLVHIVLALEQRTSEEKFRKYATY